MAMSSEAADDPFRRFLEAQAGLIARLRSPWLRSVPPDWANSLKMFCIPLDMSRGVNSVRLAIFFDRRCVRLACPARY